MYTILQLVEAYATVIESCQLFHLQNLSNYYTEKALLRLALTFTSCVLTMTYMTFRCSDTLFGLEDLATYVHLLNVALNTKLLLGKIEDALQLGKIVLLLMCCIFYHLPLVGVAARRIAGQMHGVSMEMITLPLLLYVQLSCLKSEILYPVVKRVLDFTSIC